MKNFDASFFFEQPLTIINSLRETDAPVVQNPRRNFDIQFFPEGGNLVQGLTSTIAFKIVNQAGESVSCKGLVLNQKNDILATFETLQFGMGHFILTPTKNESYIAIVKIGDTSIRKELPVAEENGYVINVNNRDDDNIKVAVTSSTKMANEQVYLFVHSSGLLINLQPGKISNGGAEFLLSKNKLSDGISHFTVFNHLLQPVCERLFFKQPAKKLSISLQQAGTAFDARSKVTVSISTENGFKEPISANMSLSVFLIDSLQTLDHADIHSYLSLVSELKGNIESPGYYFDDTNSKRREISEAADNLMLTQGWSRFRWDEILQPQNKAFEFIPELEGPIINGTVNNKKTGIPAENKMAYLSIPGKNFTFVPALSHQSGNLQFNVKPFYGAREMIVQTNYEIDSNYSINITDPFTFKYSDTQLKPFAFNKKNSNSLLQRSIAVQTENIFNKEEKQNASSSITIDTIPFYQKPDQTYQLDAYTRFTTMEEVMREYVEKVRVQQTNNKFHFKVWNADLQSFYDDDPLKLIDGVPVFNTNKLLEIDPLKIKKLDVVTKENHTGPLISQGILSYTTYEGDLAGYSLDPNVFVIAYPGLQQHKEFYSPVYTNVQQQKSRLPDFRNQLFWSPNIQTNNSGKAEVNFYTSDMKGKYAIILQGISKQGEAGSAVITFDVN